MTSALDGLYDVDWSKLARPKGARAKVAPNIEKLADRAAKKREAAWETLSKLLFDDAGPTEVGVAAFPFLLRLAADTELASRAPVLVLACDTATGGHWNHVGLGPAEAETMGELRASADLQSAAHLVDDDVPAVRVAAAMLLSLLSVGNGETAARLEVEEDTWALAGLLIAHGFHADPGELVPWLDHADAVVRGAAGVALAGRHEHAEAAATEFMKLGHVAADQFVWCDGALDRLAFLRLSAAAGVDAAERALLATVEQLDPASADVSTYATWAMDARFERREVPLTAAELSPGQRHLLCNLSQRPVHVRFEQWGVAHSHLLRRRWLGLDPAQPADVEVEVEGVRMAAWVARKRLTQGKRLNDWSAANAQWAALLTDALPPRPRLTAFCQRADIGNHRPPPMEALDATLAACTSEEAVDWAQEFLAYHADADPTYQLDMRFVAALAVGVIALHTGTVADEHVPLFSFNGLPAYRAAFAQTLSSDQYAGILDEYANRYHSSHVRALEFLAPCLEFGVIDDALEFVRKALASSASKLPDHVAAELRRAAEAQPRLLAVLDEL